MKATPTIDWKRWLFYGLIALAIFGGVAILFGLVKAIVGLFSTAGIGAAAFKRQAKVAAEQHRREIEIDDTYQREIAQLRKQQQQQTQEQGQAEKKDLREAEGAARNESPEEMRKRLLKGIGDV